MSASAQWDILNSGTNSNLTSVFFTDENNGYTVGSDGIIMKTTNGGDSWTFQNSGTNAKLTSVFFADSQTGYVVGYNGVILKTMDGGNIWSMQVTDTLDVLTDLYFVSLDTGFVIGYQYDSIYAGKVLRTIDGGNNWESLDWEGKLASIHFPHKDTGYVVGSTPWWLWASNMIWTVSCGNYWYHFSYNLIEDWRFSIFFTNSRTGFSCGRNTIEKMEVGYDWIITDLGDVNLYSIFFPNEFNGYVVGSDTDSTTAVIFKTTDSGLNWENQEIDIPQVLLSVYFVNKDTGYVVGNGGTILRTKNGSTMGFNDWEIEVRTVNIHPNPASEMIFIELSYTPIKKTSLTISNTNGQQLVTQPITEPQTEIDISYLPAGIYIVKVWNDKDVMVQKVIKQ